MEGRKEWKKRRTERGKREAEKRKRKKINEESGKGRKAKKKTEKRKNSERSGKEEKENRKRTKSKMKKHKFSPTTSQARGLRDTKNAAIEKTPPFCIKTKPKKVYRTGLKNFFIKI